VFFDFTKKKTKNKLVKISAIRGKLLEDDF